AQRNYAATSRAATEKAERICDEEASEDDRDGEVDVAEAADDEEQKCQRQQARSVGEDVPRGRLVAAHDRQHRHAGALVIVADEERERPEMGRRPEEDDREEQPRRKV